MIKIPNRVVSKKNLITKETVQNTVAEVAKEIDKKLGQDPTIASVGVDSVSVASGV